MLLSMASASNHADVERANDATEAARVREYLFQRAEQPFLEEWDHVAYGQVYHRQGEPFGIVYEALPPEPSESIETRDGGRASLMVRFWIRP